MSFLPQGEPCKRKLLIYRELRQHSIACQTACGLETLSLVLTLPQAMHDCLEASAAQCSKKQAGESPSMRLEQHALVQMRKPC